MARRKARQQKKRPLGHRHNGGWRDDYAHGCEVADTDNNPSVAEAIAQSRKAIAQSRGCEVERVSVDDAIAALPANLRFSARPDVEVIPSGNACLSAEEISRYWRGDPARGNLLTLLHANRAGKVTHTKRAYPTRSKAFYDGLHKRDAKNEAIGLAESQKRAMINALKAEHGEALINAMLKAAKGKIDTVVRAIERIQAG